VVSTWRKFIYKKGGWGKVSVETETDLLFKFISACGVIRRVTKTWNVEMHPGKIVLKILFSIC